MTNVLFAPNNLTTDLKRCCEQTRVFWTSPDSKDFSVPNVK